MAKKGSSQRNKNRINKRNRNKNKNQNKYISKDIAKVPYFYKTTFIYDNQPLIRKYRLLALFFGILSICIPLLMVWILLYIDLLRGYNFLIIFFLGVASFAYSTVLALRPQNLIQSRNFSLNGHIKIQDTKIDLTLNQLHYDIGIRDIKKYGYHRGIGRYNSQISMSLTLKDKTTINIVQSAKHLRELNGLTNIAKEIPNILPSDLQQKDAFAWVHKKTTAYCYHVINAIITIAGTYAIYKHSHDLGNTIFALILWLIASNACFWGVKHSHSHLGNNYYIYSRDKK